VATNAGGRTTYRNVDTQRQGVEASLDWRPLRLLAIDVAYTWLDAEFDQDFNACTTVPCLAGDTPVDKGTRMPGVPEGYLYAGVAWGGETGWTARVDGRYVDAVPVNDVNSASAPSYALADVSAGYGMRRANWRARLSLRVDNVFDKKYVGSVIVNDGNSRYYEPGPDRGFMAVLDLGWMP
jgi:iron complex outermembrane receptor protein